MTVQKWARENMKVIVVGLISVVGLIAAIVITSTIVRGEISTSTVTILTSLFAPTLAGLLALMAAENAKQGVKRLESQETNKSGRHVRSVDSSERDETA